MKRALVTDGPRPASVADAAGVVTSAPPEVMVTRVTGAGDTFMAAHIAGYDVSFAHFHAAQLAQKGTILEKKMGEL